MFEASLVSRGARPHGSDVSNCRQHSQQLFTKNPEPYQGLNGVLPCAASLADDKWRCPYMTRQASPYRHTRRDGHHFVYNAAAREVFDGHALRRGQPRTPAHSHRGEAGCGSRMVTATAAEYLPEGALHLPACGGGIARAAGCAGAYQGRRSAKAPPPPRRSTGTCTRGTPTGSRTITNELSPLEVARSRYGSPPRDGALERAMDVRGVAGGAAT